MGNRAGSTPLLNDMTEALVLDALERGALPSEAARAAGVNPSTMRRWCQRGREAAERAGDGEALTDVEERMRTFFDGVERATMKARLRAVDRFQSALTHEEVCLTPWATLTKDGEPYHPILDEVGSVVDGQTVRAQCQHKVIVADWKAAVAYLERTDPENWGRVNRRPDEQPRDEDPLYDDTELTRQAEALLKETFPEHYKPGALSGDG